MAASKKFLNDNGAKCVEEALCGLVRMHPTQLRKLEGLNVVVRADLAQVKDMEVSIISGGGSGHEPANCGLVGQGMLTAAVCGGVFASPSVDSVLATIRTVTGRKGALLIVLNYTGDRLNFGLAVEQARAEGFDVEIVFVADDAALDASKGVTGRRGLAGLVLVHKLAGAAAAAGGSLKEVAQVARNAAANVRTVGVALSVCNVPGKKLGGEARLSSHDGKMEVGLGVHGEPGLVTVDLESTNTLIRRLCGMLVADFTRSRDNNPPRRVAALINNLGGTTPIEICGICNALLDIAQSAPFSLRIERLYAAPLLTSLEMHGISLSLLAIDEPHAELSLSRLDALCTAVGWPGAVFTLRGNDQGCLMTPVVPAPMASQVPNKSGGNWSAASAASLGAAIRAACVALVEKEPQLTEWDRLCGDGDAGETFARGAQGVLEALDAGQVELNSVTRVAATLAEHARRMGGTSGAVLAIFFRALEASLARGSGVSVALLDAVKAVSFYGGARQGYRTMLDPLIAVTEEAKRQENTSGALNVAGLARAAQIAADETASMVASAGRSNYVPSEKIAGVPDPGAKAVQFVLEAMSNSLLK